MRPYEPGRAGDRAPVDGGTPDASVSRSVAAPARAPTRVIVVSALRLLRDGLADALVRRARVELVTTSADAATALQMVRVHAPDVLLLDMALPDGLALVRAVAARGAAPQVVAFAVTESDGELVACIEAGVAGYIGRDGTLDDVVATIESVGRGETLCSPRLAASLFRRLAALERERRSSSTPAGTTAPARDVEVVLGRVVELPGDHAPLTPREREILALIERGLANKEIAGRLGIEVATVKNHVHRILEKLRVARRGQAAARARD